MASHKAQIGVFVAVASMLAALGAGLPQGWSASWTSLAWAQETSATGIFRGVGVTTEIDAKTGALTLDHEDIKGLMPAMVMMYRVATPDLSTGLKKGDKIAFDIDAQRYTITAVKLLQHAQ
jgi:Cu/Ag efflux protein CusF